MRKLFTIMSVYENENENHLNCSKQWFFDIGTPVDSDRVEVLNKDADGYAEGGKIKS